MIDMRWQFQRWPFPRLHRFMLGEGLRVQRHQNESARRVQPIHGDRHEAADRGLRTLAAGSSQGVKAVGRKLVRRDIVPDVAGFCCLGQQVSDHVVDLMLRSGDLLVPMEERSEFGVVMPAGLVGDEGVRFEHGFQPLASVAGLLPDFGEILEVAGDLMFVPGAQDRFDVWEVLVQGRASDAGLLGDLRHSHRPQPVFGHQRRSGVQDRVAHLATVSLDRLGP